MPNSSYSIVQFISQLDEDLLYLCQSPDQGGVYLMRVLSAQTVARVPYGAEQAASIGAALRVLDHPNIKPVIRQIDHEGQPALIMPYFEGESLEDRLISGAKFTPDQVVRICLDLIDALEAAHRIGIQHGALRPVSVILTASGATVLSEWGMNLVLPAHWQQSPFVAPELRQGDLFATPNSDLWSLGALMFTMLTGTPPSEDIIGQSLTDRLPNVPLMLADLIERLLDPNPYARPARPLLVGRTLEQLRPPLERSRLGLMPTQVSLPQPATRFFGREYAIDAIINWLNAPHIRLITITGAPGIGKSTLAIEAANRLFQPDIQHPQKGAWQPQYGYFVRFTPASRPDQLMLTLVNTESVSFSHRMGDAQQVLHFLKERSALLVLDDVEYFPGGAEGLQDILNHAPGIKLLVTSTDPLGLKEEHPLPLNGLEAYAIDAPVVDLFEYLARRAYGNSFSLSQDQRADVLKLCRRLGGSPLAIGWMASAAQQLSIQSLIEDISNALNVDATTELDAGRVRAVFEFIWLLLSAREREVITRLSAMHADISPEAALALCGATSSQLRTLTYRGLLMRIPETGYFTMHPLVRHYAQTWLQHAPYASAVWRDHALYILSVLRRDGPLIYTSAQLQIAQRLTNIIDDMRAAWSWAIENQRIDLLLDVLEGHAGFLTFTLRFDEGEFWYGQAADLLRSLPASPERDARLALFLFHQSIMARHDVRGEDALRYLEQAEALDHSSWSLEISLQHMHARGLYELSFGSVPKARAHLEQMLTMALYQNNPLHEMMASLWLGASQHYRIVPDRVALERGKALLKRALEIAQQSGDEFSACVAALHMGISYAASKNPQTAAEWLHRGLRWARRVGNQRTASTILVALSEILVQLGRYDEAIDAAHQQLSLSREQGHPWAISNGLSNLAQLEILSGQYEAARHRCQQMLDYLEDPRGKFSRATARCIYAYSLLCLGERDQALQQVQRAVSEATPAQLPEVCVWEAAVVRLTVSQEQSIDMLDAILNDHRQQLTPPQLALVYALRARAAMNTENIPLARQSIMQMNDIMPEVVRVDYPSSTLTILLNPRLYCSIVTVEWLNLMNHTEEARARLYEMVSYVLQTDAISMMLYALYTAALTMVNTHPQQASTWIWLCHTHPNATHMLKTSAHRQFEKLKQTLPHRAWAGAPDRALGLDVREALRQLRALL